jgi:heme exporter protein D
MNWNNASEFFSMGGYGLYVWGSYGVTAMLMMLEPLMAARRNRQALRQVNQITQEDN